MWGDLFKIFYPVLAYIAPFALLFDFVDQKVPIVVHIDIAETGKLLILSVYYRIDG